MATPTPDTRSRGRGAARPEPTADRPADRAGLARRGEDLACDLLTRAGLKVVDRNWRCGEGEIDIVARAPGLLVVCEVKTRRGHTHGSPAAAVTPAKRRRLRHLAAAYLAARPVQGSVCVRFDVVSVTWPRGQEPTLHHLSGVL